MSRLERLETIFFDLDGCIWFGDSLAGNAAELVACLRDAGRKVAFLSNVTSTTAELVAVKLTRMGIPTLESQVMTPFSILGRHPLLAGNPMVFLIGNQVIRDALRAAGLRLTQDPGVAEVVVVSRDTELTYHQLAAACEALYRGASLLALNLDARVPVEGGIYMPGNGAVVAALTTATGVQAEAIGKPSRFFFECALERFAATRETTAMVGDNLDSDIKGGLDSGLLTVQVGLDGFTQLAVPPVPDHRVADLFELQELLTGQGQPR